MDAQSTNSWELRIGEQVRALRIASLMDQAELADRANISRRTLGSLERGDGSTLATLIRVVRVLGREDWLQSLDPIGPGPSPIELLRQERRRPTRPQRVPRNR